VNETSQNKNGKPVKKGRDLALLYVERAVNQWDIVRYWFTRAWRIGLLMAKGSYLISERKKLFTRLGEETFAKMQKGDLSFIELAPLSKEIQDLTKKIEIEELLIRKVRFGTSSRQSSFETNFEEPNHTELG
jgi:hypothetical protein